MIDATYWPLPVRFIGGPLDGRHLPPDAFAFEAPPPFWRAEEGPAVNPGVRSMRGAVAVSEAKVVVYKLVWKVFGYRFEPFYTL